MTRMTALILGLALAVPTLALATPPRVVTMTDRLVGQNEEGLFVEREVEDNLGYHYSILTDLFLVLVPYDGSPPRLVPMRSVLQDLNRAYEEGLTVALEELFVGPTDLHAGLRDAGAAPVSEGGFGRTDIVMREVGPDAVVIEMGDGGTRWRLAPRAASERAWARTRAALPVARPFDASEEEAEFYAGTCRIETVREVWVAQQHWQPFAAVVCEEASMTQSARFWLRLAPE